MIARDLKAKLLGMARKYPVVTLTGPRQSGKSTLLKTVFPDYEYVSLEDLDISFWAKLFKADAEQCKAIYAGDKSMKTSKGEVISWKDLSI